MLIETALFLGTVAASVPTVLWQRERGCRQRQDMAYNFRIAQSLGHAATLRDHETGAHNLRVAYMASLFGEAWGLDRVTLRGLMKGAFLHDVGKIGISDTLLLKQGPLNAAEQAVMQQHPLLAGMPWFDDAVPVVLHHHEKFDGTGYPNGLRGEQIPLAARLFTVIDVLDALLSKRPYKTPMTLPDGLAVLARESGSHFDPVVVRQFVDFAPIVFEQLHGLTDAALAAQLEHRRHQVFGM
ncbi:HD domain-containing phosphohydrolase [Rhodoferax sp.]|uniref:HD-GYP domain-containing protein n=1 Tax=Rhodoferax sp. TaxID=50421 RepID=UPI00284900C8|nr:HD domain-containing phosphohydrolase [Rhodoferax sp.]MDR3368908.1 HD domain-containing phosphohydrolase [Rhodoferax sp.]